MKGAETNILRNRGKSLLIEPHDQGFTTHNLGGLNVGPAIVVDMPGPVDKVKRIGGIGKIGPGGLIISITIPVSGHFNHAIVDGINRFITVIFEFIGSEIAGNVIAVLFKDGNRPITVGHGFKNQVFLNFLNGFLAAGKTEGQQQQ
jgi:hypothetical protein